MSQTTRLLSRRWVLGVLVAIAVLMAGGADQVSAQCCSVPDHAAAAAAKRSTAGADSVCVLEISGMTCGACAAHVQKALSGVKDVKEVKVSYENKKAVVRVAKPSSKAKALAKAVQRAGFGARVTNKGVARPVPGPDRTGHSGTGPRLRDARPRLRDAGPRLARSRSVDGSGLRNGREGTEAARGPGSGRRDP